MAFNVHSVASFLFSKRVQKGPKRPKIWLPVFKSLNLPLPILKVEKF